MSQNIHIRLSDETYSRARHLAEARRQEVGEAIADFLAERLPEAADLAVPPAEDDPAMQQEKEAYLRLYPELRRQYAGQYVAIQGGRLVDHDEEYGALFERIDDRFPDTFVWLCRVGEEPIGVIVVRSPRFVDSPDAAS
jgi:hypothetical protein